MSRMLFTLVTIACLISLASGCRNCRWFGGGTNPCCGPVGASTMPPPPTGSLQIPSLGKNQPYYNGVPTMAMQPSYLVNPNSSAPRSANSPTLAPPGGWQPVNANGQPAVPFGTPVPNQAQPQTVLPNGTNGAPPLAPAGFATQSVPVTPRTGGAGQFGQVAPNGVSYSDSVNYRSTHIDERLDDSRLPATDATGVRAPTTLVANPAGARVAQSMPIYGSVVPFGQPAYPAQPTTFQPQTQYARPAQPGTVQGTVQYGQPTNTVYNGYAAPNSVPGLTSAGTAILAQSTTTFDPQNNPASGAGWRDRELTTQR